MKHRQRIKRLQRQQYLGNLLIARVMASIREKIITYIDMAFSRAVSL